VRNYITALVIITVLPSIYLAFSMVSDITFKSRAQDFISKELTFNHTLVTQKRILPDTRVIEITFAGDAISKERIATIEKNLNNYNLENTKLVISQANEKKFDITSLKTSLLSDLYSATLKSSEIKDNHIQTLEKELAQIKSDQFDGQSIARELQTQYPFLQKLALAKTPVWQTDGSAGIILLVAYIEVSRPIPATDQRKIMAWLKVRTKMEHVTMDIKVKRK